MLCTGMQHKIAQIWNPNVYHLQDADLQTKLIRRRDDGIGQNKLDNGAVVQVLLKGIKKARQITGKCGKARTRQQHPEETATA